LGVILRSHENPKIGYRVAPDITRLRSEKGVRVLVRTEYILCSYENPKIGYRAAPDITCLSSGKGVRDLARTEYTQKETKKLDPFAPDPNSSALKGKSFLLLFL